MNRNVWWTCLHKRVNRLNWGKRESSGVLGCRKECGNLEAVFGNWFDSRFPNVLNRPTPDHQPDLAADVQPNFSWGVRYAYPKDKLWPGHEALGFGFRRKIGRKHSPLHKIEKISCICWNRTCKALDIWAKASKMRGKFWALEVRGWADGYAGYGEESWPCHRPGSRQNRWNRIAWWTVKVGRALC